MALHFVNVRGCRRGVPSGALTATIPPAASRGECAFPHLHPLLSATIRKVRTCYPLFHIYRLLEESAHIEYDWLGSVSRNPQRMLDQHFPLLSE
jgi:hypothetical protein